jgi:hypothetical protein
VARRRQRRRAGVTLLLEVRGVDGEAVEALRVLEEDRALQLFRDVLAVCQLLDGFGKAAVPVRVVGREEQVLVADPLGDVG